MFLAAMFAASLGLGSASSVAAVPSLKSAIVACVDGDGTRGGTWAPYPQVALRVCILSGVAGQNR